MKKRTHRALGCLCLALTVSACGRREIIKPEKTEETPRGMSTAVHMADPASSMQLLRGFHSVEGNAWRWTAGKFAVTLGAPLNANEKGATLQVRFTIPDVVVERLKSVTLSAKVAGVPLPPETYGKAGEFVYTREAPPSAFKADTVLCEFELDRALPPTQRDQRELGLVMASIALEPK